MRRAGADGGGAAAVTVEGAGAGEGEGDPPATPAAGGGGAGAEGSTFSQDILAGISTACVAMPQSCAYALLAGTGVKCAVMAAAAASVPCALLGSSRYMQVGCLSLGALLTRGTLVSLGLTGGSEVYVMGASLLAFYAGLTRIALGVGRMGDVLTSLPVALLQGFVSAATWMVFFSQVPNMVGAKAVGPMAGNFATAAFWLFSHPLLWHPGTAALAAVCFVVMLNGSKIHKMFPSALTCCLLGCVLASNGLDVGSTVGAISVDVGALFPPAALQIPKELIAKLVAPGIALGAITFLEGGAVMRMWADKDGEKWDSNKDLIAQGVANVCSAAVGGMTVAGVISRSSFGITAGAKTRLAHGVTGVVLIAFTLFGGGELLAVLPKAVLGALVSCGVLPLLGPSAKMRPVFDNFMGQPYAVKRDAIICWATAWFTFTATPTLDIGLYKGCAVALMFKMYELARGRDKDDGTLYLVEGGPPPGKEDTPQAQE
jgi:SulP family sulfate permease